jgi:hypothetical protein
VQGGRHVEGFAAHCNENGYLHSTGGQDTAGNGKDEMTLALLAVDLPFPPNLSEA